MRKVLKAQVPANAVHMSTYDLMYFWHGMEDVARAIWGLSPPLLVSIAVVLSGVVYFSFRR